MCRMILTYKPQPLQRMQRLLEVAERPYRSAKQGTHSFGMAVPRRCVIDVERSTKIPYHDGIDVQTLARPNQDVTMYHFRCAFDFMPGETALANTHPFIRHDRYAFMHNGVIPYYYNNAANQTDSEMFLDAWLSQMDAFDRTVVPSLKRIMSTVDDDRMLMNIVMVDTATGELLAYRHNSNDAGFPGLFVHKKYGIITNFAVEGMTNSIPPRQMWHRPHARARFGMRPLLDAHKVS